MISFKKIFTSVSALVLLMGVLLWPVVAFAAGGSISLSANKGTVASGSTVIIAVYMNGGGNAINAVQADLNYPASKLQYVGFSANGSAFEIGASSGGGDGTASLARGTTSSVSGSGLVGTVTFRALVGSGSASIGVAGSSSLVSDGNAVPYSSSGVSVNFGATAAGVGAKAAPAAPAPPKDTAAPVITGVKVKDLTPFTATITWTTNEPSDSAVDYGLDINYGLANSASPPVTAHSVTLSSNFLAPQTLFHYRVKSVDGAGNVATGTDLSFQLPGVPVTIIVRGPNGQPQAGASVTLDSATGTTDGNGSVTLPSSLGNKKITTTYQGVTIQKPITVSKTTKPLPPIQLDLAKKPLNPWMLTSLGLIVVVLTLLVIDMVLFGSHFFAKLAGVHLLPHGFHRSLDHATTAPAAVKHFASPPPTAPAVEKAIEKPPKNVEPVNHQPAPAPEKPVEEVVDDMMAITKDPATSTPLEIKLEPAPITNEVKIAVTEPLSTEQPAILKAPPSETLSKRLKKPKTKTRAKKTAPKLSQG